MSEMKIMAGAFSVTQLQGLQRELEIPEKMIEIAQGDTKVMWNAADPDEVAVARRTFDDLRKKKRYLAYKVGPEGQKAEVMDEFDPEAGKIILAPPMRGG